MATQWTPTSWKDKPALQQPPWPEDCKLDKILELLGRRLPLVFSGEVDHLKQQLAHAAQGEVFLLQGGDCAERFYPTLEELENKLKILLQMNMVLMYAGAKPVLKVGRFAGQFAKPRSQPTELVDGEEMTSYFGDIVNRPEKDGKSRLPNPKNMLDAYNFSAAVLNIVRGLSYGGFADLHEVHSWNKAFLKGSPEGRHYEETADGISRALDFMHACGIRSLETEGTTFYTSHEALLLDYESALTRRDKPSGRWYDLSAHMLWLGDRTRQPDGSHVEFLRGVANPLGVKIGPSINSEELCRLVNTLNPDNEWGRLTLITRFGCSRLREHLPALIETVKKEGFRVLWSCDPMHGNTQKTASGYKTRDFADILCELQEFFAVHKEQGTIPGGVHLELTGDDVTECTGGAEKLTESSLKENYLTACDPRLNAKQALELAFLIARELAHRQQA